MPSEYISTKKKVQILLDELLPSVKEMNRTQLYLHALRRVGASQGTVDKVLELYASAGEIEVTHDLVKIKNIGGKK